MATNKNALIRYQVLDNCFRNPGRRYFIEDLLEACNKALFDYDANSDGIERRQLYDDIRFMESEAGWSIPLKKERIGRKMTYRYEDLSFSISNQPLNDSEIDKIKSTLQIISRFSGTPQFEWVNEMMPMLESKFGLIKADTEVLSFESNIYLQGKKHINPLFNAIINQRVLDITYKDFKSDKAYTVNFHPYYLKQYNNRWFVLGYNSATEIPYWNLALDRIESITETGESYVQTDIDWDEYFDDIIGVTRLSGADIEEITLEFSKEIAPYVMTKPLHPSQKQDLTSKGLVVRIKVIPNYELESLILSYGEQVRVISPQSLKERISKRLKLASNLY